MIKTWIIVAGTGIITAVSWRSLGHTRSHGFSRFFAFEAILVMIVMNSPSWFDDPFSIRQMISWLMLSGAFLLAIHGFQLLHKVGRPQKATSESPNLSFENTSTLVTVGAYRFIRHPLYASLLLLAWGAGLKVVSPLSAGLTIGATAFLVATAKAEERENITRFGEAYREYMSRTRLFIPYIL